jgi:pimeloyl-ACP methyl ester carboxylesterase
MNLNQTMSLKDNRTLGYATAGDPDGVPLFLCHGLHSSRLEVKIFHEEMKRKGIHAISIDRAGMGLSTFDKHRTVFSTVEDMIALAEHLEIEKFSILGSSSGAKYALGMAYRYPHRLHSCHLISSAVPVELMDDSMPKSMHLFTALLQKMPWLIQPVFWLTYGRFAKDSKHAEVFLNNITLPLKEVDKKLLKDDKIKTLFWEIFSESYRQGTKPVAYDAHFDLFHNGWGFDVGEISIQNIHFWHGQLDGGVPYTMAQKLSNSIKGSTFTLFEDDGHLSLFFNKIEEVLEEIVTFSK